MILKEIELTNFRNHQNYKLDFEQATILIGRNGIGKTNLIEAIYLLATNSSFRTNHSQDLIRWGEDLAIISARVDNDKIQLAIERESGKKLIKINNNPKKGIDLLGRLVIVLFSANSIDIIAGPPNEKRRFLNLILSQLDKAYAQNLLELKRVINQRNHLLYRIKQGLAKINELDFWDHELYKLCEQITLKRDWVTKGINQIFEKNYQKISGNNEKILLKYQSNTSLEHFLEIIENNRQQEIKYAQTLYGPHRDNIDFFIDNHPFESFGSRGELRSAALALKISELDLIEQETKKPAVFLLDDVYSELDSTRRKHLNSEVTKHQTIITTTDYNYLDQKNIKLAKVVNLENNGSN